MLVWARGHHEPARRPPLGHRLSASPRSPPTFPRQIPGHRHAHMVSAFDFGGALAQDGDPPPHQGRAGGKGEPRRYMCRLTLT